MRVMLPKYHSRMHYIYLLNPQKGMDFIEVAQFARTQSLELEANKLLWTKSTVAENGWCDLL